MKIALMTNNYKPFMGGVPISVDRLAKGLREQGHEVTVFAPTYQGQKEEEGVFRYNTCMKRFIGGIVLPNPFDWRIEKEFRENHYDIIHVHHPILIGNTAVYLSKKYNIPLVFTYHTRYEKYLSYYTGGFIKFQKMMTLYLRMFFKKCSFIFAPTKGMEDYLTDVCRVPPEKVGILPTGLERESYLAGEPESNAVRTRFGAENMPLLLSVSRMAKEKNVEFLLEGLAETKALYKKPFKVLLVGEGPDRKALERKRDELGLQDTVIFTGAVPNQEIAPFYKAADGFVFASMTETQGIVILEAFAGKTPVVAVRASGVEDLVENGKNGILTPENPQEYAVQLTAFLNNGKERLRMTENAYARGLDFRQESVAREAIARYNEVIAVKLHENEERNKHGEPVSYSCG